MHTQDGRSNFLALRKAFNLIVEDTKDVDAMDISYVYAGYAPLSIRIVQNLTKPGGLARIDEVLCWHAFPI